jgi:hypothetical protein
VHERLEERLKREGKEPCNDCTRKQALLKEYRKQLDAAAEKTFIMKTNRLVRPQDLLLAVT